MRISVTSWPKIIGALVGGVGLNLVFSAWMLSYGGQQAHPRITCDWPGVSASALLLIMGCLLATGREWARRILLLAVVLIGVFLLFRYGSNAVGPISFSDLSPEAVPTVRLWTRLGELSWFFLVLALLVFAILFLCHPDVVASFRRRGRSSEKV